MNSGNIHGKVVLITGASSGIGETTARLLARQGATVVRDGGVASCHEVDVTQKDQVEKMIAAAAAQHGRIDALVSNAGLMALSPIASGKTGEWDRMIDLNIKGMLYGIAAVWPVFEKQKSGHFINIASIAGLKVAPGNTVYCATKHAVRALSEGLRMESRGKFRVTIVSPGYVESELMYGTSDEATRNGVVEAYKQNAIPADSIAGAILYAISQPDHTSVNEIVVRPTVQEF
ncbi:NADP-dependent 3-hydroxy acid dehydrogenase YdfG [Ereboglobus sp. PH5-5]|uniref:SDR family oxidoreductase n=1 Tax=Ereboglobus sp. PH5-5 TaxID=2940529 RepID=UPI00240623B2|nr:SDR family oxidoreductase [Ereboglobus sp. PH5-5]MDF9832254.1 NADP-dependent 3-hydroxy acid dehydrogenase YdfG [Ereboglobus sp. PH5-5]